MPPARECKLRSRRNGQKNFVQSDESIFVGVIGLEGKTKESISYEFFTVCKMRILLCFKDAKIVYSTPFPLGKSHKY